MASPPSPDEWDLDRIRQLVTEHELERGRIEYKSGLGNGRTTLEAIAALANTFGGLVLIGVDEDQEGLDRLAGVPGADRDRLSRMCWDQLTPPFNPEIHPVKLDEEDRYVLVVVVDSEFARRPVMLTQGNKVLVRIEGHNVPADWYRLRELFAEQQDGGRYPTLPPSGNFIPTPGTSRPDLGLRGRLLLTAPRGRSHHITEAARTTILATLNDDSTPLTGKPSTLAALMHVWANGTGWDSREWHLYGVARSDILNAQWHGLGSGRQSLTQARLPA